jgi:hypothetical protein
MISQIEQLNRLSLFEFPEHFTSLAVPNPSRCMGCAKEILPVQLGCEKWRCRCLLCYSPGKMWMSYKAIVVGSGLLVFAH